MKKIIFVVIAFTISFFVANADDFTEYRKEMVQRQIKARGIKDERVINAILKVPRHKFVPGPLSNAAYEDIPLPIGYGQTISQPYIVAFMTEVLNLKKTDKVLEIGTGSGYQAAILAELCDKVYTIEIIPSLRKEAEERLKELGYKNIEIKTGDGYLGWEEKAPFDAIIVTAAPPTIPEKLVEQLALGGRMVLPLGNAFQELYLVRKTKDGIRKEAILPVRFVPMVHGE